MPRDLISNTAPLARHSKVGNQRSRYRVPFERPCPYRQGGGTSKLTISGASPESTAAKSPESAVIAHSRESVAESAVHQSTDAPKSGSDQDRTPSPADIRRARLDRTTFPRTDPSEPGVEIEHRRPTAGGSVRFDSEVDRDALVVVPRAGCSRSTSPWYRRYSPARHSTDRAAPTARCRPR